ncbi:hypothetical protein MJ561_03170 [Klebsiella pneumoniae]|nr:hypothetical protein MJ561_03170 [Klebsiella pneumoniae]
MRKHNSHSEMGKTSSADEMTNLSEKETIGGSRLTSLCLVIRTLAIYTHEQDTTCGRRKAMPGVL